MRKTTLAEVRRQIDNVRRFGFVVSRSGVFDGTGMVAMLLPRTVQEEHVALGVGGPVSLLDMKLSAVVDEMRRVVDEFR